MILFVKERERPEDYVDCPEFSSSASKLVAAFTLASFFVRPSPWPRTNEEYHIRNYSLHSDPFIYRWNGFNFFFWRKQGKPGLLQEYWQSEESKGFYFFNLRKYKDELLLKLHNEECSMRVSYITWRFSKVSRRLSDMCISFKLKLRVANKANQRVSSELVQTLANVRFKRLKNHENLKYLTPVNR